MKNNLKLILTIIVTALACVLVPSPASTADTGKLTVMRSATFGKKPILDVYLHRKRVGHAVNQVSINQKNLAQVPLDPFEHSPSRFFVWILRDEFAAEGFDENRRPCVALVSRMQIGSSSSLKAGTQVRSPDAYRGDRKLFYEGSEELLSSPDDRGFKSHPFRFKEGIEPKVVLLFRQNRHLAAS